ncbi:MAG: putative toxin-antitoxin system toxin component, PIN family [Chitinophagaceae bacterium]
MQKVILDTNIIVSGLIQKSFPYLILNLYFEREIELCLSENLMNEYIEVLNRDKFSQFQDFRAKADTVISDINSTASYYSPKKKVKKIRDPDDNMLLELAWECKADFLVTGNTNDFTIKKYKRTKIVTPREYWELHKPG